MFWRIMLSCVLMIPKPWDAICLQETSVSPAVSPWQGVKPLFPAVEGALTGFKHSRRISFSFSLLLKCPRGACWSVYSPSTPHRRLHFLHPTCTTPDLSVSMCKSARLSLFVWPAVCPGCVLFIFHVYLCVVQLLSLTASLALVPWWCRVPLCLTTSILLDGSAARCLLHAGSSVCFTASSSHEEKQKV